MVNIYKFCKIKKVPQKGKSTCREERQMKYRSKNIKHKQGNSVENRVVIRNRQGIDHFHYFRVKYGGGGDYEERMRGRLYGGEGEGWHKICITINKYIKVVKNFV